jgi:hypothetical protein
MKAGAGEGEERSVCGEGSERAGERAGEEEVASIAADGGGSDRVVVDK